MIKRFFYNNELIAFVIKRDYTKEGITFFTDDEFPEQIAYMSHKKDTVVMAHVHNKIERKILVTQEVLILKKGKIRLDLYNENKEYIESYIAEAGDIIFLASGGHGLKCLEDVEMYEVKQGPYLKEQDKVRFQEVEDEKEIIND